MLTQSLQLVENERLTTAWKLVCWLLIMAGCLTECVQQLYDDEKLQLGVQELIRLQRWQDKTPGMS